MTAIVHCSYFDSPLGRIFLQKEGEFLTALYFPGHKHWAGPPSYAREDDGPFAAVREQLAQYFAGERQDFDVPFELGGTPFQKRVWDELTRIPFGRTIAYAELARRVGQPNAYRAVGAANGRNPVSIIVPCHRVIGAGGQLTGYGGGMDAKRWLLDWEQRTTIPAESGRLFAVADLSTSAIASA